MKLKISTKIHPHSSSLWVWLVAFACLLAVQQAFGNYKGVHKSPPACSITWEPPYTVPDDTGSPGSSLTSTWLMRNNGCFNSNYYLAPRRAEKYVNGRWVASSNLGITPTRNYFSLSRYKTDNVSANFSMDPQGGPGRYRIYWTIYFSVNDQALPDLPNGGLYSEVTITNTPPPPTENPDIEVSEVYTFPSNPEEGESTTIYATIRNVSGVPTSSTTAGIFVEGTRISDHEISPLSPGGQIRVSAKHVFPNCNNYKVQAAVAPVDNESSRSNNLNTIYIDPSCAPPPPPEEDPDIAIDRVWIEPSNPKEGDRFRVFAKLRNISPTEITERIRVTFTIIGQTDDYTETGRDLSFNETVEVDESFRLYTCGSYRLRVEVRALSGESNLANNTVTQALDVDCPCEVPSEPNAPTASQGTYADYVRIDFTVPSNASHVDLYRDGVEYMANLTSGPVFDSQAAPGARYSYHLVARNVCDGTTQSSPPSDPAEGWLKELVCPSQAPSNFQASDAVYTDKVLLTWEAVPDASIGCTIIRDGTEIETNFMGTSYEDLGATGTHSYEVHANSSPSCSDTAPSAFDQGSVKVEALGLCDAFDEAGATFNVPSNLLRAMAYVESGWDQAASYGNDFGIMQLNDANLASAAGRIQARYPQQYGNMSITDLVALLKADSPEGAVANIRGAAAKLRHDIDNVSSLTYPGEPEAAIETWFYVLTYYNGGGNDASLLSSNYPYRVFNVFFQGAGSANGGCNTAYVPKIPLTLPPVINFRKATQGELELNEANGSDAGLIPNTPEGYIRITPPFQVCGDLGTLHGNNGEVLNITGCDAQELGLVFPIKGYDAYSGPVNAVVDRASPTMAEDSHVVSAFGEIASKVFGSNFDGYKQSSGAPFNVNGNYTAAGLGAQFLFYDGHNGWDYRAATGTKLYAATNGTFRIVNGDGGSFGVGYIEFEHQGLPYRVKYVHCSSFLVDDGASVSIGEPIATVGSKGTNGPHLHFGVEKRIGNTWYVVDPYGWQANTELFTQPVNGELWAGALGSENDKLPFDLALSLKNEGDGTLCQGESDPLIVAVSNAFMEDFATDTHQASVTLTVELTAPDGSVVATESVTEDNATLVPSEEWVYTFFESVVFDEAGTYSFTASLDTDDDENSQNNTIEGTVEVVGKPTLTAINGPTEIVEGETGNFSVTEDATEYFWTVPATATIASNSGKSIDVQFFGTTGGEISLYVQNELGCQSDATSVTVNVVPPVTDKFTLISNDAEGLAGTTVNIPITVKVFKNILGIQGSINWDEAMGEFVGVEIPDPTLASRLSFGTLEISEGKLRLIFLDISGGSTLPDDTVLFNLQLNLVGQPGDRFDVLFSDDPLPMRVVGPGFNVLEHTTVAGQVSILSEFEVSGEVIDPNGAPVSLVDVSLDGALHSTTTEEGTFSMMLDAGGSYSVGFAKNTMELNGVSVLDGTLITAHLLGHRPFGEPWEFLAADTNGDGAVFVDDAAIISEILLGNITEFPNSTPSWKLASGYASLTTTNWMDYSPELAVESLSGDQSVEVRGIKTGSVAAEADPSKRLVVEAIEVELLYTATQENQLKVSLAMDNGFISMGGRLNYDPSEWELIDYEGVDNLRFGTAQEGAVHFLWKDELLSEAAFLEESVFDMHFKAKIADPISKPSLDTAMPFQIVTKSGNEYENRPVSVRETVNAGGSTTPEQLEGVYPNPVSAGSSLKIGVTAEQGGDVKITLVSVIGHILAEYQATLNRGANTLAIEVPEGAQGIVLLRVSGVVNAAHKVIVK